MVTVRFLPPFFACRPHHSHHWRLQVCMECQDVHVDSESAKVNVGRALVHVCARGFASEYEGA
jgi:hypothetical protein